LVRDSAIAALFAAYEEGRGLSGPKPDGRQETNSVIARLQSWPPFGGSTCGRASVLQQRYSQRFLSPLILAAALLCAAFSFAPALAAAPLNYLYSYGDKADPIVSLTWGVLIVSLAVTVIIALLVAGAIWRRPRLPMMQPGSRIEVAEPADGMRWIWIGVSISTAVLLASVVWTVAVLAQVSSPAAKPALTIEVTGRQWWWQVRYLSNDPSRIFTTANEIHIPTGMPVRFILIGGDVIHSFWVPALGGKTDTIPGQTNETWLEAHAPGTYRGQCTEYCGIEHAHMGLIVVAQTPGDFQAWWAHQLLSPEPQSNGPQTNGQVAAGLMAFNTHCGSCHAVRGTDSAGVLGPDLSHLMNRGTIAAGELPNDPPDLARFITDPQGVKPGILMQKPELSANELADIQTYLKTLN
jgi:cytochrome c oxidase subunit 2